MGGALYRGFVEDAAGIMRRYCCGADEDVAVDVGGSVWVPRLDWDIRD